MANQDTSAALSGSLSASADANVEIEVSASLLGSGLLSAIEDSQATESASFYGSGSMSVDVTQDIHMPAATFSGQLSAAISPKPFINISASIGGSLSGSVVFFLSCSDIVVDFAPQHIISSFCNKGESVAIKRFRGDTYPVTATLSKRGIKNITGFIIKFSSQVNKGTIYTTLGTITDAENGEVRFDIPLESIDAVGKGVYDIEVNDGTYIYTYEKGEFEIISDLTV